MCFRVKLLKSLLNKDNFDSYGSVIRKKHLTGSSNPKQDSDEWQVFRTLKDYMKEAKETLTVESLKEIHMRSVDDSRENTLKAYEDLFNDLATTVVDKGVEFFLSKCKQSVTAEKLMTDIAMQVSAPNSEELTEILSTALEELGSSNKESGLLLKNPEEAFAQFESLNEFNWKSEPFNRMAGGFGRGRSCLLFALANMGKSSFTIDNIAHWLEQGIRVLDISIAEDTEARRVPHVIQTLAKKQRPEISENYKEYYTEFYNKYKDQYAFSYNSAGTPVNALKKLIKEFSPDIVIVDGFGKLTKGKSEVNHAKLLGLLLADLKSMAEENAFGLICVSQAADRARGKKVLNMNDIADSKVDIAGECEIIVGIGCDSEQPNLSMNRVVNFSKSKLGAEGQLGYTFTKETNEWKAL